MKHQIPYIKLFVAILAVLVASAASRAAPATVDGTVSNPAVPGVLTQTAPVIDGEIGEGEWAEAPIITEFQRELEPARFRTTVRVLYTADEMFFAFVCEDSDPGAISALQKRRNGRQVSDDNVAVGIDPRADKQQAWWFMVNARGTQADEIPGGAPGKVEWRGDWRAATKRTSAGWQAEIAIPFEILRYRKGQDRFGLMFERRVPRFGETHNWPIRTSFWVHDNEAFWGPLQVPTLKQRPLFMPYALVGTGTYESSAGIDAKYTSANGLTSLATIKPDFQTIEDVINTVDYSYNPQYLDDKRPFFTEGGDYFDSRFSFYSRNVETVDAGLKSFGKVGPWQYAVMGVADFSHQYDGIANLAWRPNEFFNVRAGVTENYVPGHYDPTAVDLTEVPTISNTVARLGASYWKPLDINGISVDLDYWRSDTTGQASGDVLRLDVERFAGDGVLEYEFRYQQISPFYDARLAYVPERDLRGISGWLGKSWLPNSNGVKRWRVSTGYDYTERWNGGLFHRGVSPSAGITFSNDIGITLGLRVGDRQESPAEPLYQDRIVEANLSWNINDIYRRGSVFARYGTLAGGPYSFVNLNQGFLLTDYVSASFELSDVHLDGTETQLDTTRLVASVLYDFSAEKTLSARLITGKSTENGVKTSLENFFVAYRQEVRRGADIYVIVGDPNTNSIESQFAVKYVQAF